MAEDKTFRMLIEEQKRTTDAIRNLVTTNEETSVKLDKQTYLHNKIQTVLQIKKNKMNKTLT